MTLVVIADRDEPTLPKGATGTWYLIAGCFQAGGAKNWTQDPGRADPFLSERTANNVAKRMGATRFRLIGRPGL